METPTYRPAPVTVGRACRFLDIVREGVRAAVQKRLDVSAETPEPPPMGPTPATLDDLTKGDPEEPSGYDLYNLILTDADARREVGLTVLVRGDGSGLDADEVDDVPADAFADAYALFLPASSRLSASLLGLTPGSD